MATIKFDGRKTVGAFIKQFEDAFNAILKVYKDNKGHVADNNDLMANVQVYKAPTVGDMTFRADMSVSTFCKKVEQEFGYVVKVFRRDGRVSVPDNIPLSFLNQIRYQANKSEMDAFARNIVQNIGKEDLSQIARELDAKSHNVKDKKLKEDIKATIQLLDDLEKGKKSKDYVDIVRGIIHKYGVLEVLSLIGAIMTGNIIGIGTNSAVILEKIYEAFKNN